MRRAILLGLMVAPIALIAWKLLRDRAPDLEPPVAASIISSTSEFKATGSLVNVATTTRVSDSVGERYYAKFTFLEHGPSTPVKANGTLQYWSGRWHLRNFDYGEGPNHKWVDVKSEVSPEGEFSK